MSRRCRVLFVDDDAAVRDVWSMVAEDRALDLQLAANAADALSLLDRDPRFDVLVTDVMMPGGMNGAELAQLVRDIRPDLRVIVMTGYAGNLHLPPDVLVLRKPFRPSRLIQLLEGGVASNQSSELAGIASACYRGSLGPSDSARAA